MEDIIGIVLAAGKGTRMKSTRPKVLHQICGRPMLYYSINCLKSTGMKDIYIVVGYCKEDVKSAFSDEEVKFVEQDSLLGTADALKSVIEICELKEGAQLVVIYGDFPTIRPDMIRDQFKYHSEVGSDCTIGILKIDSNAKSFKEFGRVIRDKEGELLEILEKDELTSSLDEFKEVNLGIYCFRYSKEFYQLVNKIQISKKGEYYLTNIVKLLNENGFKVKGYEFDCSQELVGVNTQGDVAKVNKLIRLNIVDGLMQQGVTIINPESTYIQQGAEIGKDTVIYPNVFIEKDVKVGKECVLGPCSRLRIGTVLEDEVEIGNFVEIVRSYVKKRVRIKHFSYIGDATIEENVNIGAGTITANFDGKKKNPTFIKRDAFIGSGTILIAPITIGENAVTGAGAVVTKGKDVPDGVTVVGIPAKVLDKNRIQTTDDR